MQVVVQNEHTEYRQLGNILPVKWSAINATADGDNTVIAAVTDKKIRILSIAVSSTSTATASLKSGASTTLASWAFFNSDPRDHAFPSTYVVETAAGEAFVINCTAGQDVLGWCVYVEIPTAEGD